MSQDHPPLHFTADPEHGGLRTAVLACFVVTALITFVVAGALLADVPFGGILTFAAAIGAAILVTRLVEAQLKARWPSGRALEVDGQHIRLTRHGQPQFEVDGAQHVNVLAWRFPIQRRTRVPKGWYVVALALTQEDVHLPVYTFMSPDDFQALELAERFVALAPARAKETDLRLAGQQRRLREAELWRWNEGAEISQEDFVTYLEALQTRFSAWMVKA
jgi:hypothetical protein